MNVIVYNSWAENLGLRAGVILGRGPGANGFQREEIEMVLDRAQILSKLATIAVGLAGLTFCIVSTAALGYGQSLAGRWAATGRTLDNGEQEKSILELKQDGNQLTGTVTTLGFSAELKGTATGDHFELFVTQNAQRPFLTGDLVNGELHADRKSVV